MNLIILTFLNLDLLEINEFAQQFIQNVKNTSTKSKSINLYVIDHLVLNDAELELPNDNKLYRISINSFINSFSLDTQLITRYTTHQLYRDYLAYLSRANSSNRKLIENIFYLKPELIDFLNLYVFSIIKLASIIESYETPLQIISCDPIFHQLLSELKTYQPSAVELFYSQISEKLKLQIWGMPHGIPSVLNTPTNCTSSLVIPFKKQKLIIEVPQLITKLTKDDISNLDVLSDANKITNNSEFIGQINNAMNLEDIKTGLDTIFQQQIINRDIRVPRQHLPKDLQPIQIFVTLALYPAPDKLVVLADVIHQLTPELIPHHQELINRELKLLQPEIDILALEWELKIQRQIKFNVQIKLQTI